MRSWGFDAYLDIKIASTILMQCCASSNNVRADLFITSTVSASGPGYTPHVWDKNCFDLDQSALWQSLQYKRNALGHLCVVNVKLRSSNVTVS